jgi:hypothetical protein
MAVNIQPANWFVSMMASSAGRMVRVMGGIVIVALALLETTGIVRPILTSIGIVVFLAGVLNFCILAPLLRQPFWGARVGSV